MTSEIKGYFSAEPRLPILLVTFKDLSANYDLIDLNFFCILLVLLLLKIIYYDYEMTDTLVLVTLYALSQMT